MFSQRVRLVAATAVCCASVVQSPGFARTLSDTVSPPTRPAQVLSLTNLLQQGAPGGACITEADIDQTVFATGKGPRLPRSCLPEPCKEALTPVQLAELIGRPLQQSEWDRYFARYADVCRKEVTSFEDEAAADIGPMSITAFWAPILGSRITQSPPVIALPSLPSDPVASGLSQPPSFPFESGPFRRSSNPVPNAQEDEEESPTITFFDDPEGDPDGDQNTPDGNRLHPSDDGGKTPDEAETVGVVPLPAAFWMLFAAFGGLFGLRRRRR
ncbi:hypothetical protein So717_21340 [Roseobacter cerasinus]|uniref:Secreted protein n=1 Tax=Roseobacter cerasinus TaxID=2602289 RepID=A0A640VTG9_9RHOB|nr:VPLPA-CTERM sorting domain-containing protein [Roseobacter cerasinus]GFE50381.1 hypothetical protein So717_21340 [Roseobacter cerasinus]